MHVDPRGMRPARCFDIEPHAAVVRARELAGLQAFQAIAGGERAGVAAGVQEEELPFDALRRRPRDHQRIDAAEAGEPSGFDAAVVTLEQMVIALPAPQCAEDEQRQLFHRFHRYSSQGRQHLSRELRRARLRMPR